MSHEIVLPIDRVFSTAGTEWHGLATPCEAITNELAKQLCPSIIASPMSLDLGAPGGEEKDIRSRLLSAVNRKKGADGNPLSLAEYLAGIRAVASNVVQMPAYKALVADYREVRPDLASEDCGALIPLHVPRSSYSEIENGALWSEMQKALANVDAKVTCAGTLKAGKVFFISCQLGDGGKFAVQTPHGEDSFLANLNFITSHDGTLGVQAYDSTTRIVCMNTLRWSLEAAGEIGFNVYHTKNANVAMANLGALVNRVLTGRANFRDTMGYLATVAISESDARALFAGYFVSRAFSMGAEEKEAYVFATRTKNALDELTGLFTRGLGNAGKSLYDVLNAGTEYWTRGNGTGAKASAMEKLCKANFGQAADHKTSLANLLLADDATRAAAIESGKRAEKETAQASA